MWASLVLLVCLTLAAWNDVRAGLIPNRVTYTGILLCFLAQSADRGSEGLRDAGWGFLTCGGLILLIYLFGGTGGGDVKLIALLGAGLGWQDGLAATLWTFALGALMAMTVLIWRLGAARILAKTVQQLWWAVRLRGWLPLTPEERQPLQRTLFLAPAALVALLVVRGPIVWRELSGPATAISQPATSFSPTPRGTAT
ncbi:MAG: prepilin peptidase [Planctomycetaceae bacterium]